jgi:hypothetical protein
MAGVGWSVSNRYTFLRDDAVQGVLNPLHHRRHLHLDVVHHLYPVLHRSESGRRLDLVLAHPTDHGAGVAVRSLLDAQRRQFRVSRRSVVEDGPVAACPRRRSRSVRHGGDAVVEEDDGL